MEFTNQLADLFSRGIWILAICGLLLYLPLKSHWNRIFSFWDALIFYCSLGVPALLIVSYIQNTEDRGAGSLIFTIAVSAIAILIGFVVLCCCWGRCGNVIEGVFLPFICLLYTSPSTASAIPSTPVRSSASSASPAPARASRP